MITVEFRQMVAAELLTWMSKHQGKVDLLLAKVAEAIGPAITEELHRGLLTRLGELEPDEREKVSAVLRQVDAYVARYAQPPRDQTAELDRVRQQISTTVIALQGKTPPSDSPKASY